MKHRKKVSILFISIVGALLSLAAIRITLKVEQEGSGIAGLCSINELFNCASVAASKYAFFYDVPVSWIAFLFYTWISGVIIWTIFSSGDQMAILVTAFLVSTLALIVSIFKAGQMIFQLQTICIVCILMYFVNTAISIILFLLLDINRLHKQILPAPVIKIKELVQTPLKLYAPGLFSITVVFLIGISVFYFSYDTRSSKTMENGFNVSYASNNAIIDRFFEQKKLFIQIPADAAMWGNSDASTEIVIFSDFQCPFCADASIRLQDMLREYREQIILYFIHFPLDTTLHPYAGLAARAAIYANDHSQFWKFHDALFSLQPQLSQKTILSLVKKYGWNTNQFESAINSISVINRLNKHIKCGQEIGIKGTPSLFINGRMVEQWDDTIFIRTIIQREIHNSG